MITLIRAIQQAVACIWYVRRKIPSCIATQPYGSNNSAAVAGWMQRRRQQLHAQQKAKKHPFHPFGKGASRQPTKHVDLNYSKDDSSEGDVYGVEFNEHEENVLETIVG